MRGIEHSTDLLFKFASQTKEGFVVYKIHPERKNTDSKSSKHLEFSGVRFERVIDSILLVYLSFYFLKLLEYRFIIFELVLVFVLRGSKFSSGNNSSLKSL